jgi:acetyltransferase-like isoleucine patch superfamily enzyme
MGALESPSNPVRFTTRSVKMSARAIYRLIKERFPTIGAYIKNIYFRTQRNDITKKIRGRKNRITYANSILRNVTFDIDGCDNNIDIKENCILNNVTFYIRGNNHSISIKNNCRFNSGGSIWFEDDNGHLTVGEHSTFEDINLAVTEPKSAITIGCDCMFAYDIDIRTGDSHSIVAADTNERINYAKDVIIGNHVWVAAHSVILKGVIIKDNSVVATGSIVTSKYSVSEILIGGNPAKKLKEGISWTRARTYKEK